MSTVFILLLAGVVLFGVSMALFRGRRHAGSSRDSILKGGSATARLALVAWWASLGLLAASMVLRAMQA